MNAIAVDPSDPSGNTVYVGGASGGIWKTTDFLTTNPAGPTWIPLTNFGPNAAINISSIAIFPRNGDPTSRSSSPPPAGTPAARTTPTPRRRLPDLAGRRRHLERLRQHRQRLRHLSQTGNPCCPSTPAARDREFVGTTAYQVAIDPQLTPSGAVIIYAASEPGTNGGIWRSEDTGQTWTQVLAGNATAVVLDQDSGIVLDPTTGTDVQGNLQIVYAGIEGQGVYMSTNQGQSWTLMTGGVGNPLIINLHRRTPTSTAATPTPPPTGTPGRIALAVPASTGNAVQDADLRGLALRRRRHPERRLRRPVRHQGLRRELDPGPASPPSPRIGIYNQAVPSNLSVVQRPSPAIRNVNYAITDDTGEGNLGTSP